MNKENSLPAELVDLRSSIDNIDAAIIFMLSERFKCTKRVGELKSQWGLPPADPEREEFQISRLKELSAAAKLDPVFAERFLRFIIEEVIRHHKAVNDAERD